VQDEGVDIRAQVSNDERDLLRHQASDEGDVARESIELRDNDRAATQFGLDKSLPKLRTELECVGAFAALHLDELGGDLESVRAGETRDCLALGLDPEA
jgi:hypothetical protein